MTASGPFSVGERVYVAPYEVHGTVEEIGPTETIRVFENGEDVGLRQVTMYSIRLDSGIVLNVADRDGHIASAS